MIPLVLCFGINNFDCLSDDKHKPIQINLILKLFRTFGTHQIKTDQFSPEMKLRFDIHDELFVSFKIIPYL